MTQLAPLLTAFLREHLARERRASVHTCDAYAFSFQRRVTFTARRLRTRPCRLRIEDLDVAMILAVLRHIEEARNNKARSRNARLAAVKSFFRYLERRDRRGHGRVHRRRDGVRVPEPRSYTRHWARSADARDFVKSAAAWMQARRCHATVRASARFRILWQFSETRADNVRG